MVLIYRIVQYNMKMKIHEIEKMENKNMFKRTN